MNGLAEKENGPCHLEFLGRCKLHRDIVAFSLFGIVCLTVTPAAVCHRLQIEDRGQTADEALALLRVGIAPVVHRLAAAGQRLAKPYNPATQILAAHVCLDPAFAGMIDPRSKRWHSGLGGEARLGCNGCRSKSGEKRPLVAAEQRISRKHGVHSFFIFATKYWI